MILIKLGGSIITNKKKPLSPRKKTIENIAKNLKKIGEPLVIVHGGGSYGHYWSVKYDMHTQPRKYDTHGVSIVKNSMIELNKIILDSFLKKDYMNAEKYFERLNRISRYNLFFDNFVGNVLIAWSRAAQSNKVESFKFLKKISIWPYWFLKSKDKSFKRFLNDASLRVVDNELGNLINLLKKKLI